MGKTRKVDSRTVLRNSEIAKALLLAVEPPTQAQLLEMLKKQLGPDAPSQGQVSRSVRALDGFGVIAYRRGKEIFIRDAPRLKLIAQRRCSDLRLSPNWPPAFRAHLHAAVRLSAETGRLIALISQGSEEMGLAIKRAKQKHGDAFLELWELIGLEDPDLKNSQLAESLESLKTNIDEAEARARDYLPAPTSWPT